MMLMLISTEDDILAEVAQMIWTLSSKSHLELRDYLLTMGINLTGIEVSKRNRSTLLRLAEQCVFDWRNESLRTLAAIRREEVNGSNTR